MKFDLLIKNGIVVTPSYTEKLDIVVDKGKIVSLCSSDASPEAERTLNAEGLHVLPGVIDEHVHFREPGLTYKEDFGTGSMAAAAGGVTCIIDMPNVKPPTADPASFKQKAELASSKSYVDFGIIGVILPTNLNQIGPLAEAGVIGYKIFMGPTVGSLPSPDDQDIIDSFENISKTGLRIGVHAENRVIIDRITERLKSAGRTDALCHLESRPSVSEAEAVQRAILFSKPFMTKLHIYHTSSKEAVGMVREAKREGFPVTCETGAHYLLFDGAEALKKLGPRIKMNPPVRTRDHAEALWQGLKDGTVDSIASDHSPHTKEEKMNADIWKAIPGFPGVETTVPLILTEVNKGRMSLNQYVKVACENPARLWGMYPRKGATRIGSDADLTIVNMKKEGVIKAENLKSKNKIIPFEGMKVTALPAFTIVRGNIVMENGKVTGKPQGVLVKPVKER